jgi:hypothetical protein
MNDHRGVPPAISPHELSLRSIAGRPAPLHDVTGGPPAKDSEPTPENVAALDRWLLSITAGHARADTDWRFYEEIDRYLGPWGQGGYPLSYGKKYCRLFTNDPAIVASQEASAWVRRITIILQHELRKLIVSRYRARSLGRLTEAELRRFAFDSHPKAYTQAGLTVLTLIAPELLPTIVSIPKAEFVPGSPNFTSSLRQVFMAGAMTGARFAGHAMMFLIGPSRSGVFRKAKVRDEIALRQHDRLARQLAELSVALAQGRLDHIGLLIRLLDALDEAEFPDDYMTHQARRLRSAIQARVLHVRQQYEQEVEQYPDVYQQLLNYDPAWQP